MHQSFMRYIVFGYLFLLFLPAFAMDDYEAARQRLIQTIREDVRATVSYINKHALDQRVMQAMSSVPRHEFVPMDQRPYAYLNRPLPIGYGQTISQPYIVAIMTDLLELDQQDKVLEVGTGSAYQAAILAELVARVYSIEIIKPLAQRATSLIDRLQYANINIKQADGYYGWEENAPFDAIIVTAAASHIPPPLIKQLKPGGNMVIPVGSRFLTQELLLIHKKQNGHITTRQIMPVIFVPLTGDH